MDNMTRDGITVGEDGKVGVAEICTPAAIVKRPIHKVAVLPVA